MATPVDTAMADDRPAKQTIRRDLWLDVIKRRAQSKPDNVYLYATLAGAEGLDIALLCLLYTSPSPRDRTRSRMPSSA